MAGSLWVLALLALACLAPLDGRARADEPDFWYYQCMEDEENSERICTTEIVASDGGRDFLIYFAHDKGGKSPLVVTGEALKFAGTTIKVDREDPVQADKCDVGMCYFELEKSRLLLRQFRKGRRARVSIIDDALEFILDKEVTLRGFSATYAKF
jgi:invasion protein IalB